MFNISIISDAIKNAFSKSYRYENSTIEVEARFFTIRDFKTFNRIKKELEIIAKNTKTEVSNIFSTDYIYDSQGHKERETLINHKKVAIIKETVKIGGQYKYKNNDYGASVSVNIEKSIATKNRKEAPFLIRNKDRMRVHLANNSIFIDLTKITSQNSETRITEEFFEIEVEINSEKLKPLENNLDVLSHFNNAIHKVLLILQNTVHLYTNNERDDLIRTYNRLLGLKDFYDNDKKVLLNHNGIVTARNLKKRDCVFGGLIGNKIQYSITPKAEGHRKQLVITESAMWLVYPPYEISCILKDKSAIQTLSELHNTIFDGENIEKNRRLDDTITSKYFYLPFDVMVFNNNSYIQNEPHFDRLKYCDVLLEFVQKNPIITFMKKPFIALGETYTEFNNALKKYKKETENLPYMTDGCMFTPINSPYKTKSDFLALYKRKLTKVPDICKLKPWEKLTIDLKVIMTFDKSIELQVTRTDENRKKTLVEFTGDYEDFTEENLDTEKIFNSDIKNGDIVEFGPEITEGGIIKLKPLLIRTDKLNPNGEDIAKDVWNDINKPLTMETLEGKNFSLVFQYHNTIKRSLFSKIPEGYDLIDFGYGRGGDLTKQLHFHKILGIEPNVENYNESKKRYKKMLENEKIEEKKLKLLNCKAQEYKEILKKAEKFFKWTKEPRKLCISFMLSLSFFWESPEKLNELIVTLKKIRNLYYESGGSEIKFIFMTIDGQKTRELIDEKGYKFKLGPASFTFKEPNNLHINIEDTIVTEQDEYLVNVDDLDFIENLEIYEADKELFLSKNERIFTKLYKYGWGDIKKEKKKKEKFIIEN